MRHGVHNLKANKDYISLLSFLPSAGRRILRLFEKKREIEKLAQAILDARELFPESSLADLYDPLTMPPVLLKSHKALDKAVMKLYKFGKDMSEAEIVAELMERYRELISRGNNQ